MRLRVSHERCGMIPNCEVFAMLALFNLGGGEIVLILALLLMLLVVPAVLIGVIFLVIRLTRKSPSPMAPPASKSQV